MDAVESLRCVFELIIFPVVSWLGSIFARDRKAAAESSGTPQETPAPTAPSNLVPRTPLDPKVEGLQRAGDLYGLLTILHTEDDPVLRLDAADALAQIGNEEGADYLIRMLESPETDEREAAREALAQLNDPHANAALQSHPAGLAASVAEPAGLDQVRQAVAASSLPEASSTPSPAGAAWTAYFDRQTSMENKQPKGVAELSTTPKKPSRWLRDFGPGALGALLVTLGFLVFWYLAEVGLTAEDKLGGLFAELICFPVTLAIGGLAGALASLVVQSIARAVHLAGRAQQLASTIGALISGAVAGAFCDALGLLAAYI